MSEPSRFEVPGLVLTRAPAPGLIVLRLRADDAGARTAAAAALGAALPPGPARPVLGPPRDIFWTAPDAFLLDAGSAEAAAGLACELRAALAGRHAACHPIADARACFGVAGAAAAGLLAKGTGIDLDPRVFVPGSAALSRLASLPALIVRRDAAPAFAIFVDRPAGTYLWDWLTDAARSVPA